jgi:hypothetical protein
VERVRAEKEEAELKVRRQEEVIAEMKKQIMAYRREIIDLSSAKKLSGHHHHNSKSEGRRVPRLDLSKLHRDSEDGDGKGEGDESCGSLRDVLEDENGKNVTYQQYLKFLENEKGIINPNDPNIPHHLLPPNFHS